MTVEQQPHQTLEAAAAVRWRIAVSLGIAMVALYFGFVLLVAFRKQLLATPARLIRGLRLE